MAQLVRKKPEPIWIDNKWKLWYKIGEGSFGEIFRCKDKEGLSEVAVKLESRDQSHPQLIIEKRVLDSIKNSIGFPNVHYLGPEGDYIAMIMDLLGPSLEDMFNFCNRTFSYQTVLLLGDQMLDRVQFLHNHDYLHRDLKPDNFLTGVGPKANIIYMIDFGLAKRYRELPNYKHLVYKTAKSLTGTARYASMNTHEGIEQSRRDDIEALAYCLIYFYRGLLPWQGINGKTKAEKYEVIYRGKKDTPVEDLCGKNGMLMKFLSYSRNLQFDEEPNYAYLRKLIRDEFKKHNFVNPTFDWNLMALMKSLRRSNDLIVEHKNMIKNKKIKVEDPLFVNEIELNEEVLNKDKKPIIISRTPKLLSKMGAAVFDALESENELLQRNQVEDAKERIIKKYNISTNDYSVLEAIIVKSIPHKAGHQWRFSGAFYYCITVVTTIGYGHSTPMTIAGKTFCMFYALAGIPLGLVMFQSIGERLNTFAAQILACCKKYFGVKDSVSHIDLIIICSGLGSFLIAAGAWVFHRYEDWTYFDSLYYCFVTLTTIGFGDFVALQKDGALQNRPEYVIFTLVFILFGLTVISAAMNLLVLRFLTMNTEDEKRDQKEAELANRGLVKVKNKKIVDRSVYTGKTLLPRNRKQSVSSSDSEDTPMTTEPDNASICSCSCYQLPYNTTGSTIEMRQRLVNLNPFQ
uniref:Non-specific serine/threonine protein kinase n=1 Tax=Rhabditophanes sp. KR3021 TaxID=114890 RepID=A0AC35U512_9BILA